MNCILAVLLSLYAKAKETMTAKPAYLCLLSINSAYFLMFAEDEEYMYIYYAPWQNSTHKSGITIEIVVQIPKNELHTR